MDRPTPGNIAKTEDSDRIQPLIVATMSLRHNGLATIDVDRPNRPPSTQPSVVP
jgi:hypothetical protein